jgi:hypothetical protein
VQKEVGGGRKCRIPLRFNWESNNQYSANKVVYLAASFPVPALLPIVVHPVSYWQIKVLPHTTSQTLQFGSVQGTTRGEICVLR